QRELAEVSILPAKAVDLSSEARNRAKNKLLERVEELSLKREDWEPLYNNLRDGENIPEGEFLLPLFYEKLETIFDYLPQDIIVALIDPLRIFEETDNIFAEAKERAASEKSIIRPDELYLDKNSLDKLLEETPLVAIEPFKNDGLIIETESNLDLRQDIALKKDLSPLKKMLKDRLDEGFSVFVTAHNKAQAERLGELLDDFKIISSNGASIIENIKSAGTPAIQVCEGSVSTGFRLPSERLVLLAEEEIFGERIKRRPPKSGKPIESFISQLKDLSEDDFVVHSLHGIGRYKGLKRISVPSDEGAIESDFLLLEYRDKDKLYVPVIRLDLITKYHGAEGATPETDKLGGVGWEKKKGKVKKAVNLLAVELIKLYAERSLAKGYAFSAPSMLFTEFEAGFEYDETPDQMRAIEDVMRDMGNERPMDRLICGDVGYGKTEVAMRAAFRAVSDSKQACILVPTTILAQQHYLTFKKRFAPFPVSIEVLSRFRSKKEQKETLDKLAAGKVDIVIGTHRLLQKDISFKDLGLLVIDEEHRFGVKHKEKLKNLKKGVDVLTLTATPIPRTLHMAFADLRAMSIINTPPEDRLAITTRVVRLDDTIIREAIERELKRGGQVFFVHNRVESIGAMHEYLLRITSGIKEAIKIGIGHGQMKEDSLEKVMLGFTEKKYDILLTTTIIESGLDIPSANTIVINRADRFGLAELYQLRGRVGRSSHRAYAYLVCPEDSALSPEAIKRMDVIRELSELGGGFRLAAYDLEIRGAGELLGQAQSGHIAEVGFDMYTEILEEAVMELRGEKITHEAEPEVDIKVSMYIPDGYVPDARQKITLYKRLATASFEDELSMLEEELVDRYGEIPELVRNLVGVSELKLLMKKISAVELSRRGNRLYLSFAKGLNERRPGLAEKIIALAKKEPDRLKLQPDAKLVCIMSAKEGEKTDPVFEARYLLKELTQGW
ncbi:MAG: transcription-repair coupling factor, partial [Thermodesulfobacteriota bacterium]